MTKIVQEELPNAVCAANIRDGETRRVCSLVVENIKSLKSQIAELQKAVCELQRRQ